jgi:uncharacterized protein YqeY
VSSTVRNRLRAALPAALKQRDPVRVSVLRATLAALDNAEAPPAAEHRPASLALELTPVGAGAAEVPRRDLSDDDVERLVRAEIDERRSAADVYERSGRHERARRLRSEAAALAADAGLPEPGEAATSRALGD